MHIRHLYFVLVLALFSSFVKAQAPTATIAMPASPICTGKPYTFSCVTAGIVEAYSWSLTPKSGFTVNSSDNFGSSINITFSNPITYSITLVVSSSTATFVTGGFVTVSRSATANYRAVLSDAGYPTNLFLNNASTNYTSVAWDFGGAVPTQTDISITQPFNTPGNYSVSLIAFGASGCNDTLTYKFTIDASSEITLVNVFTPNNDGVNDVFRPRTKGLYELKVWVFDRWGVLMHNWEGVRGSWDGYTTSGIQCPAGVYSYVLEGKGFDGKEYKLKNQLTLLR
jgi:gliding motility-associated-like protein